MYTDAYEFRRSQRSQSIRDDYNTYSRKDYNYLPDTNQSVYTNNSLSLVTFDLSSIYNSSRFTDTNDLVVVLPITIVAAISQGTNTGNCAPIPPPAGTINLVSLKSNYVNLIHQCDVQINGKTCNDLQPYTNVLKNFEMLSEMSQSDVQMFGSTYGLGAELDNPRSTVFSPAGGLSGTGMTNNVPFGRIIPTAAITPSGLLPATTDAKQNSYTANTAISSRINTFIDTTAAGSAGQNIYNGSIMSLAQVTTEFKPTYQILATNYAVWYDYGIIRLGSILESLRNIGLTRRFDAVLRLYVNTGAIAIAVAGSGLVTQAYGPALQSQSTFTNTCPLLINYLPSLAGDLRNVFPATAVTQVTAGLFLTRAPATNVTTSTIAAVNLATSGAGHPMNSCRIYYSSIEMGDPQRALSYIESNRAKKVIYRNFVSNFISAVASATSYSSLIQSGLVNPVAVVVFPFISQSFLYTTAAGHVPQYGSPYDTAPATGSPVSLTNFQVTVGGVNQLNTTLQYTFESFMQHVSLYEQIAATDFGVSCGLFDRKYWEMNRAYVCLIRSKFSDMDAPRNINISFNNNTGVSIDLMVFCVYLDSLIIDVDTGRITR